MAELAVEEARAGVAVVRIDRPPANALTYDLRLGLLETWRRLAADPSVRAVVLTAAGDRFFSSGLDLNEVASWRGDPQRMHERIDLLRWDPETAGLWKPIVGAINGYCLAGGWHLAEMCDVRLAASHALFGIPEGRWGLPAVFAWSLHRRLPQNVVLEALLFPERRFTAERMYELGWLNAVVTSDCLLEAALDWAAEAAEQPAEALEAHKRIVRRSSAADEKLRASAEAAVRPLYNLAGVASDVPGFLRGGRN